MARITDLLTVPTSGAHYTDDLNALPDSEHSPAVPVTPGSQNVREPAEALSVGLVLDTGQIAWGECTAVDFSGSAGRYPVFRSQAGQETIKNKLAPILIGQLIPPFRALAQEIDQLLEQVIEEQLLPEKKPGDKMTRRELFTSAGRKLSSSPQTKQVAIVRQLHSAVRYGVSQALLQAAAISQRKTITEIICEEWNLPLPADPIPIHAQCENNRYQGVEKMIVRGVSVLPCSLGDNIPEQLGKNARKLIKYAKWIKRRILKLGGKDYNPTIHLDVHGGLGILYDQDPGKILGALYALEQAVNPYLLRIECPVICDSLESQIEAMKTLREFIQFRNMRVQLVAGEWTNRLEDIQVFLDNEAADMIQIKMPDLGSAHNAVDAILACQTQKVGAFLGLSCAETDLSARISAQIALALQPEIILAKPGRGIDERITIIQNEMDRILAWIRYRNAEG
ncbi:MAG: methylaspartate ammonia-lyase [Chloroflexi bacterium]|nr:methylaspartate ammonia-lyase [Chloroflexota bacterium]